VHLFSCTGMGVRIRTMFVMHPNSFRTARAGSAPIFENDSPMRPKLMHFICYSFTTLTSTGFGDITPTSGPSRAMCLLEAIAGQFFLAVLIARLVGELILNSFTPVAATGRYHNVDMDYPGLSGGSSNYLCACSIASVAGLLH